MKKKRTRELFSTLFIVLYIYQILTNLLCDPVNTVLSSWLEAVFSPRQGQYGLFIISQFHQHVCYPSNHHLMLSFLIRTQQLGPKSTQNSGKQAQSFLKDGPLGILKERSVQALLWQVYPWSTTRKKRVKSVHHELHDWTFSFSIEVNSRHTNCAAPVDT